jgi:hypothetical protein
MAVYDPETDAVEALMFPILHFMIGNGLVGIA